MKKKIKITELSDLTGVTRPTIYKYMKNYENGNLETVPFSFIGLFATIESDETTKEDIVIYCNKNFNVRNLTEVEELIEVIRLKGLNKIQLSKIKKIIGM